MFDDDHSNYIVQKIFCADEQVIDSNLNIGIIDLNGEVSGGNPFNDPVSKYKYDWTGPSFSSSNERIEVTNPHKIYFDIPSDEFSLNGYVAAKLKAKELCEDIVKTTSL